MEGGGGEAGACMHMDNILQMLFNIHQTSSSEYNYSTDEVVLIPRVLVITVHTVCVVQYIQ